jgi:hypothetical protein
MKTWFKALIGALVVTLLFVGYSQAKPNLSEKTFEVKPGGTFYLESDSGALEVVSHTANTVEVQVKNKSGKDDSFVVSYEQDGNDVRVIGEREGLSSFWSSSNVTFMIKVPEDYNVDLRTGGGSISLSDLRGQVEAYTSGGSIRLGQIEGDVNVKTSGGSIKVEEVAGNINAHTSGGSIKATITKQPTKDCKLTTSGGSVTAYLSPSIAVDLVASTSGGTVGSDFDVNGTLKKKSLKGTINGGGPELVLKTSGGSVRIKKL